MWLQALEIGEQLCRGAYLRPPAQVEPSEATLCWRPVMHSEPATSLLEPHWVQASPLLHLFCACKRTRGKQNDFPERSEAGRVGLTTSSVRARFVIHLPSSIIGF